MRLHTILSVAWKELQVRSKDRGSLALLFLLPLLFGSLLGSVQGGAASDEEEGDPDIHIGVYVVNDDAGPYGERVVSILREMPVLDLDTTADAATADREVGNGNKLAAVLIPVDFSQRIDTYGANVYLVNTGWAGGSYGKGGNRMKLPLTRAMVTACLNGELEKSEFVLDPVFNVLVPTTCPGVPDEVLVPEKMWQDKAEYQKTAKMLAELFRKNFAKYANMPEEVIEAGPKA